MFQKRTLRHLPPDTRKLAVACNDMETALGRWKRAIPQLASDEQRWRGEQRRLLAQGRPDVSIPDQAVPCSEHGITNMVADADTGCPKCNDFAMAWMRASLEGRVLDGEPSVFG